MNSTINICIDTESVWEETIKESSYRGDKLGDADKEAYERMFLTDADRESLQRFFCETEAHASERLKEVIVSMENSGSCLNFELKVARWYNRSLNESVSASLKSYFVYGILGRWYRLCNIAESELLFGESDKAMDDVLKKLYWRMRPLRKRS